MRVYLAGAVDRAKEYGMPWRKKAYSILRTLGHTPVFPPGLSPGILNRPTLSDDMKNHIWVRKEIIEPDILGLLSCDAVLLKNDPECGYGTIAEVAIALWARIPMSIWTENGGMSILSILLSQPSTMEIMSSTMEDAIRSINYLNVPR